MDILSGVKTILRTSAPTLLTALALPPPFNVIASAVESGVLAQYLPADEKPAGEAAAAGQPVLSPEQVKRVVESNAGKPEFILELKRAEAELAKYEKEAGLRFAEIEAKDREGSRAFQEKVGIGNEVFRRGMHLVYISLAGLLAVVIGSLYLVFSGQDIPPQSANVAVAAFGLIGTAVGFVNGLASNVVGFYWGSSQGSKEKDVQLSQTVQRLGDQLGRAATQHAHAPPAHPAEAEAPAAEGRVVPFAPRATPAPSGLLAEILPQLSRPHRHFPDGVSWALVAGGISIEEADPVQTPGEPKTVREIWRRYGDLCTASARRYGVPVELIVATIATESRGDAGARRAEPHIRDESVGLMQTLVGTARLALGRRDIKPDDLLDPALSIEAGTAYIAQRRTTTHFDPPLVAAAYNAGSIRRDGGEGNRWKLLCYPTGTGRHVETFVGWFGDCMRVSAEQGWGAAEGVPAFARCFQDNAPPQAAAAE